jgi:hypothetical protein
LDEEKLAREGWKFALTSSGEHLKRTLEMYRELGFEVRTEQVSREECGECTACFLEGEEDEAIYRVYTRGEAGEESPN